MTPTCQRIWLWAALLVLMSPQVRAQPDRQLVQVHQDFSEDPGWEGYNNRVVARNPPTKRQDFGWSPTTHASSTAGEIGGTMWVSRTPAWYAMPLGRALSYRQSFSASGRVAILSTSGTGYIGFFNSTRQEWRPWSAIGLRLSDAKRGEALHGKQISGAQIWIDYMTATWKAGYMVLDAFIPADGSVHTWSIDYDADARPDTRWPHAAMRELFEADSRYAEQDIVAALRRNDPDLAREQVRELLERARDQGLLEYDPRRGTNYWERKAKLDQVQGRITFQLDDATPVRYFLDPGIRNEPAAMDRFGLFNFQIPEGKSIEFYVSDLTVNGEKIELSRDPNWQGVGNRVTFIERDFHPGQNYGYSQTNWAGERPGEIGGLFWRNEPIDPYHGFYADDVGVLTLDDTISFSGMINFVNGGTDASMMFGYFNRQEQLKELSDTSSRAKTIAMGIRISDHTSIGYSFEPRLSTARGTAQKDGPQFVPDRRPRRFSFDYDPIGNDGNGRITAKLEDEVMVINLKPEQRRSGARFDRFGLFNVRNGGKYVEVYLDDLTYTARRAKDQPPNRFQEKIVEIDYPERGRKY
ncbi:hypothetical protein [Fontivita pretiosa]|uniref:hypothetical protein n=1 Tax=Fontivita pretiosa TaxID=2989684 RepID=UPI003D172352